MKRVGFTGTSAGMTTRQLLTVQRLLAAFSEPVEFHHGDCIGADAEAHECARVLKLRIVLHPPQEEKARAFSTWADEIRCPAAYMVRNQRIVDETEQLIAAPFHEKEILRSGTWATIRRARRAKKPVLIVLPNGDVQGGAQIACPKSL